MRNIFFIVCFFLCCQITKAQPIDLKFNFLTTENGLSNSAARCIIQDYKGYIWIGTQYGLNKFDGISCKIYTKSTGNGALLYSNLITDLCETSDKTLWVGTNIGINFYNRILDQFEQIDLSKTINTTETQPLFVACLREFDNCLYALISSEDSIYLLKRNITDSIFSIITKVPTINKTTYFPGGITVDSDKNIWFGTYASGLYRFNQNNKELLRFKHEKQNTTSVSGDFIRDVTTDKLGNVWVATYSAGASKYLFKEKYFKQYFQTSNPRSISGDEVNRIFCDRTGEIWIGMNKTGLELYNPSTDDFAHYTHDSKDKYSLNYYSVWSIFSDRNGGLWVGTYGGGVNFWSPNQKKFKHINYINRAKDWLSNNLVSCFAEDKNGNVWLGTDGGGLHRFDPNNYTFKVFESNERKPNAFFSTMIKTLYVDKNNNIWTGQSRGCLDIYNQKTNQIKRIPVIPNSTKGISNNMMKSISPDNEGNVWIGTDEGLNRINTTTGIIKQYFSTNDKKSLSNHYIRNIFIDSKNRMWLSTNFGINLYDRENDCFFNFNNNPKNLGIFKQMSINSIIEDRNGEFWVCTSENGLFKFNDSKFELEVVKPTQNFSDFNVSAILFDKHYNLWISTRTGLYKYNSKTKEAQAFSQFDGIQSNEFIENSALLLSDGRMIFGGVNGFTIFNPDSINVNLKIPNIDITNLQIFNQDVPISEKSILKKQISECDTLILSYKNSVLTFSFRALDFVNSSNNHYAYKLEPFEDEWNYVGARRSATYTNLSPGEYDLKVKGSNNDGIWNEEGKTLHIIITPPFYKTWWFRSLLVFLIIALIYMLYMLRTRQIRNMNLLLNERINERTQQLEESNKLLEENQEEIVSQKEELVIQRDLLRDLNDLLKSKQIEILNQNLELKEHQSQLENKIKERTSQLEKAKIKAEESDKLKSSFLANMSHEIRTPMNAIVGFSQLLIEEDVSNDVKQQYQDIIRNNCDGLLELINDIIDLSKIESQQLTIKKAHIEASSLIAELEVNFNKIITNSEVIIKCEKNLPSIIFISDIYRVKQVLGNFLSNAIKFTSYGEITIGYTCHKRNITFYVKDTGIGIPSEKISMIFDRFFKYENKKKLYGGTGLGLSISKELATLLNGSIHVESELSKGTTFFFTLNNCVLNIIENK